MSAPTYDFRHWTPLDQSQVHFLPASKGVINALVQLAEHLAYEGWDVLFVTNSRLYDDAPDTPETRAWSRLLDRLKLHGVRVCDREEEYVLPEYEKHVVLFNEHGRVNYADAEHLSKTPFGESWVRYERDIPYFGVCTINGAYN